MATISKRVTVWDLPLRLFHWTLVVAIALAFLSAEDDSPLNQWHVLDGWVAGILIVFRLAWGFLGGEHSRFSDFLRPSGIASHLSALVKGRAEPSLGHNALGGVAVVMLLALTGITVWTGAFGGEPMEGLHEAVAWTLLAMVGVHLLAVLVMSLLQRENLVRAMVAGTKPAQRHPGAKDARRPRAIALFLTGAIVASAIYGVLRYDPQAFTLRSPESAERSAAAKENAAETNESD